MDCHETTEAEGNGEHRAGGPRWIAAQASLQQPRIKAEEPADGAQEKDLDQPHKRMHAENQRRNEARQADAKHEGRLKNLR